MGTPVSKEAMGGILPLLHEPSNPHLEARWETVSDGQFDWGGRLLKM